MPEVETLRRSLLDKVKGQTVKKIILRWPKLVSGRGNLRRVSLKKSAEFVRGISGCKILNIERRGKNLIFVLSGGRPGSETSSGASRTNTTKPEALLPGGRMIVHLKMSGRFTYKKANAANEANEASEANAAKSYGPHDHIIFQLSRGVLIYNDVRKFGYLIYYPSQAAAEKHFESIGVEPLSAEFTPEYLESALKKRGGSIKSVLMDQSVVAGLGNIYCDEALFASGIRPTHRASSLRPGDIAGLYRAVRVILSRAVKLGGSSVRSYRLMSGQRGRYAEKHKVYGRAGEKCLRCGRKLKSAKIAGRTTVFCKNCQR